VILVIDNYDSFTFNLVQALESAGAAVSVVRNDRIDREGLASAAREGLTGIVISPGPGDPDDAGISVDAVRFAAERTIPLLGVCLGHQCLAVAYGGSIVRAPSLVHGEASPIHHGGDGLLAGLPSPFDGARYHSLCVDETTVPADLQVTARTDDGVVMGLRHRSLPLESVHCHPESVLTPPGPPLLGNFLRRIGSTGTVAQVATPATRASADAAVRPALVAK
jgi:para-aminobenzoate synthetase component 2